MLTRSLDNAPSADEIDYFVDTMAGDLYSLGYEEKDEKKIVDAFNFFGQRTKRWPTTNDIVETLKLRRDQLFNPYQKRMGEIEETEEEKERRFTRGESALAKIKKVAKSGIDHCAKTPVNMDRDMEMQREEDELLEALKEPEKP